MIPAFILSMEFECLKTFMVAHKVVYPFTFIHLITTCLHFGSTYLLVVTFQMGIAGAGLAILSTEVLNLVGILSMTFLFMISLHSLQKRFKARYIWGHVIEFKASQKSMWPIHQDFFTNNHPSLLRIFCFLFVEFCCPLIRHRLS